MSDRGGPTHRPLYDLKLHPCMLSCCPGVRNNPAPELKTMYLISGVVVQWWQCMYGYAILLFYEYYMRHGPRLTCVDHPTDPCMTSNYTPDMLKCYLSFQTQELEQCTSSVVEWSKDGNTYMDMLSTVSWALYEAWSTSDRGESSHRPLYDLQLHPRHAQMLPRILEPVRARTVYLISGWVVPGWWYMYGYAVPLFHECYMRHVPCLTGVDHLTDHTTTPNYTPDMISCYPGFRNQELEPCTSSVI